MACINDSATHSDPSLDFEKSLVQLKFNLLSTLTREQVESAGLPFYYCNVFQDPLQNSFSVLSRSNFSEYYTGPNDLEPKLWQTGSGNAVVVPSVAEQALIFRFYVDEIPEEYHSAIERVFARYEKALDKCRYWGMLTRKLDTALFTHLSDYAADVLEEIRTAGAEYAVRGFSVEKLRNGAMIQHVYLDEPGGRSVKLTCDPIMDIPWIARSRQSTCQDEQCSPSHQEPYRKAPFKEAIGAVWRLMQFTQFAKTYFKY